MPTRGLTAVSNGVTPGYGRKAKIYDDSSHKSAFSLGVTSGVAGHAKHIGELTSWPGSPSERGAGRLETWSAAQRRDIKAGDLNITGLKLKAVRLCLEAFAKLGLVRGRSMLLYEDNTGVVGILKNLCAKAPAMRPDLEAIMELLEAEDAILRVQYVYTRVPATAYTAVPIKLHVL